MIQNVDEEPEVEDRRNKKNKETATIIIRRK